MKIKLTIVMLVSVILASCSQKEEAIIRDYDSAYLNANIESAINTKVGFTDANADFFWTEGDVIGVITTTGDVFLPMKLTAGVGSATGTFSGSISGTPTKYAVYPFGEIGRHSLSGTELTYKLPAEYTYANTDKEYANANGNSHNAPMWGSINGSSVNFKHLGGVIAFQINSLPENSQNLKLTLVAENQISGTFTVNLADTEPVLATAPAQSDADKKVVINFSTAVGQTTGYFYIPVPTGLIGDLILTVTDVNGSYLASGAWSDKTIARTVIARPKVGEQSMVGGEGEVKTLEGVADINSDTFDTEGKDLIVNFTEELTGNSNSITIPTGLETETTTFSFNQVADDAEIEITATDYDGKVVVEIPVGETLPTVNASVPNGEVYIKQGTVETLVVSSAENTTIIGEKAVIENLIVDKGNVRILVGGKVSKVVRGEDNSDYIYVIFEGDIPKVLPTIDENEKQIVFVSATEFDKSCDNTTDIAEAIAAGQTTIYLKPGEYNMPKEAKGKTLTISGMGNPNNVVIKVVPGGQSEANGQLDYNLDGSTVKFNNLTIKTSDKLYTGYARLKATYYECIFDGHYCLNQDGTFENCKFTTQFEHNVWTWGANNATFKGCQFTYIDRCVNIYGVGNRNNTNNFSFIDCTFITNNQESKGAIEINSSAYANGVNVSISGCTKPAYGEMVFISGYDVKNGENATITIDGKNATVPQLEK